MACHARHVHKRIAAHERWTYPSAVHDAPMPMTPEMEVAIAGILAIRTFVQQMRRAMAADLN